MEGSVEEWRAITGSDGLYRVGNHGTVQSHKRGGEWRTLTPVDGSAWGHLRLRLGKPYLRHVYVHQLVLREFVGPAPEGHVARHLDGNPRNNSVDNLAWGTPAENALDKIRHGTIKRGEEINTSRLTEAQVREVLTSTETVPMLARRYNVRRAVIWHIVKRRTWKWVHV